MQEIVQIENNEAMTTSRQIAEVFGKDHSKVLRDIRVKIEKLSDLEDEPDLASPNFIESTYFDSQNKEHVEYKLNKDALVLVVMNYTTKEALKFQVKYINQFNLMEEHIREQQSQQFFITETTEEQEKRIKLENSTRNANSRTLNSMYRWYKEGQLMGDTELMNMARNQVLDMYPQRKQEAIETN